MVFFGENPKGGGGGLAESKISVNRKKLRIFWIFCQKGGGSHPIQKGFIRKNEIFGHILPKRGDFVRKNSEFFGIRGGVSANPKFLLTEKIWPSKLIRGGGRGGLLVWIFSEKKQFFLNDASP